MNSNLEIHIVSFTIPYPADYGGVIDVFYKIKALSELGVIIHLHCYQYDRKEAPELEKYCKTVHYYKRSRNIRYFFSQIPFIVKTRSNKLLLERLKKDNLPILFEGLHTVNFLQRLNHENRNIVVRMHNIEQDYYAHLAKKESSLFKKLFFKFESFKLKKYEKILNSNVKIAGISEQDCKHFKTLNKHTYLIEAFHQNDAVEVIEGKGDFILFHGNLSVSENQEAVRFILNEICPDINFKFIIAGKNPSKDLYKLSKPLDNVKIIANPSEDKMNHLLRNAHIHLLITFQDTGMKLKLLNALFQGRFCIVNKEMIFGTGLENFCIQANSKKEIISEVNLLINQQFESEKINTRKEFLLKNVNNKVTAQNLINLLVKT